MGRMEAHDEFNGFEGKRFKRYGSDMAPSFRLYNLIGHVSQLLSWCSALQLNFPSTDVHPLPYCTQMLPVTAIDDAGWVVK